METTIETEKPPHNSFFGPLPTRGVWTSLDLSRNQFVLILALAVALFAFIGGPVWNCAPGSHFWRIGLSYLAIPPAVAVALRLNGKLGIVNTLVASIVIGLIKLVLTAFLLVGVCIAQV